MSGWPQSRSGGKLATGATLASRFTAEEQDMVHAVRLAVGAVCVLLAAGCAREQSGAAASADAGAGAPAITVFESMTQTFIPQSNLVWELAGNLYDDDGNIDASRLTAEQWQQMQAAASSLDAASGVLMATSGIQVAPAGVKIQNEDAPGMLGTAAVQALIDADPEGFDAAAAALSAVAKEIAAAAAARDGEKADETSSRMTDVCGACHTKFWYPETAG